jgi:hypothetical protein
MTSLTVILKKYTNSSRLLGEEANNSTLDREQLKSALMTLSKKNTTFFWICAILTSSTFIICCILILNFLNDPAKIQLIFGATGISMGTLLAFMNKLWKEKVSTDMIIALAGVVKEENLNSILVALLSKI